jgi:hypothetical protein
MRVRLAAVSGLEMALSLHALVPLGPGELESLAQELAPLGLLGDVVAWAARRATPAAIEDVIVQDEFSHDVVVALSGGARWLVFDTT